MNGIDILISIFLILGAISGFMKGMVKEIAAFFAILLGLLAGLYWMDIAARKLAHNFDIHSEYLPFICFLIVLILVYGLVILSGKIVDKLVKLALLGIPNRIAGAFVGLLKTALSISVLFWLLNQIHVFSPEAKAHSRLLGPILRLTPGLFALIGKVFPPAGRIFPAMEDFFTLITPDFFQH